MKPDDNWFVRMREKLSPEMVSDPMMAELADEFLAELVEIVKSIKDASDSGDIAVVRDQSHKLKGSAGMFGLAEIGIKAGEVEAACKKGDGPETIRLLVAELRILALL